MTMPLRALLVASEGSKCLFIKFGQATQGLKWRSGHESVVVGINTFKDTRSASVANLFVVHQNLMHCIQGKLKPFSVEKVARC